MQGHTGAVYGVLRLLDKQRIITCSHDGSLRVWDLESGVQVGDARKDEGSEAVLAIALSPDGKKVASGSSDGAVTLWDIDTGKVWTGRTHAVQSVCWSLDGRRVVSGAFNGIARVGDVKSSRRLTLLVRRARAEINSVLFLDLPNINDFSSSTMICQRAPNDFVCFRTTLPMPRATSEGLKSFICSQNGEPGAQSPSGVLKRGTAHITRDPPPAHGRTCPWKQREFSGPHCWSPTRPSRPRRERNRVRA
ncbi:WD40-repeat-containing domain protein [Suillus ampliporus]|nr:WD40-repeat-containing domain protein [Suillus ampliporus]